MTSANNVFRIYAPQGQTLLYWGPVVSGKVTPVTSSSQAQLFAIEYKTKNEYAIRPVQSRDYIGVNSQCVVGVDRRNNSTSWIFNMSNSGYILEAKRPCGSRRWLSVANDQLALSPTVGTIWYVERVAPTTAAPTSTPNSTTAPPYRRDGDDDRDRYRWKQPWERYFKGPKPYGASDSWLNCLATVTTTEGGMDRGLPPFSPAACSDVRISTRDGCYQTTPSKDAWTKVDKRDRTDRRRCYTSSSLKNAARKYFGPTPFTPAPEETTMPPATTEPPLVTDYPTSPPTTEPPTTPPPTTPPPTTPPPTTQPPTTQPPVTDWPTTSPPKTQPPDPIYVRPVELPERMTIASYKFPGSFLDVGTIPGLSTQGSTKLSPVRNNWYSTRVSRGSTIAYSLQFADPAGYSLGVGGNPACTEVVLLNTVQENTQLSRYEVLDVTGGSLIRISNGTCGNRYLGADESGKVIAFKEPPTMQNMEGYLWKIVDTTPATQPPTTQPPTFMPTIAPTEIPVTTMPPTPAPTFVPTFAPTDAPTFAPTVAPTLAPSRLVKLELGDFKGMLRSDAVARIFREFSGAAVQEISDADQECAKTLLGKDVQYVQMYLAAYHPDRNIQVVRDPTMEPRAPNKGSDLVQLFVRDGLVESVRCGRAIPEAKPLSNLFRVYFNASTDLVISVYTYDYYQNATTPPPSTVPAPITATPPTMAPLPDINIQLPYPKNNRFPYPVAPDLLVGGAIDPLLLGPVPDLDPTTAPPSPPQTGQQLAVTPGPVIPIPEDLGAAMDAAPKESMWTWQNIFIAVVLLAGLGAAGYYVYKNYVSASNSGNSINSGNAGGDFGDDFGGSFGGNAGGFNGNAGGFGDFSNFGPPTSAPTPGAA